MSLPTSVCTRLRLPSTSADQVSAVAALCGCASPPGSIVVLADHQEGIVPNSTSDDDRIELTPISRPDPAVRDRRRRRRTWIVGGVALVVVVGGITALVVHANQD